MSAGQQQAQEVLSVEQLARLSLKHAFMTNTDFQVTCACDIEGPEQFTATHPVATRALELLQEHFDALSSSDPEAAQRQNVKGCLLMLLDAQNMITYEGRED